MITEPALAIKFGLTIEDLTSTFHPYLTLSEGIKLAAQTLLGADFFRSHRVYVARGQRKVYVSYMGGPVFRPVTLAQTPPQKHDSPPVK